MTNNFWTIAPTRERCENCGRYTEISKQWYSDELGHGVCIRCAKPVESTPMDQYADYFEDIQNGGLETYYD